MSQLSIYETAWIDLVFEGKNKEYGAYQLRQENSRTTLMALFTGLLLVAALAAVPMLINHFKVKDVVTITPITLPPMTDIFQPKQPEEPAKAVIPITKKTEAPKNEPQPDNTRMVVSDKSDDTKDEAPKNDEVKNTPVENNNPNGEANGTSTTGTESGKTTTGTGNPTGIHAAYELDKNPEFPGGIKNFLKYVGNNFRTPEVELDRTIKVFVSFVVEKDGSLTNIEVKKDPGYGLGAEAIRVLKSLKTKWQPGIKDGQPVRAYYNLPISIQMQ